MPKSVIIPAGSSAPLAPFVPGTLADGVVYVSGTLAFDQHNNVLFADDPNDYIGVGLSTTLHFLYPMFTVLFAWMLFKQKPDKVKIIALILATSGVALATGKPSLL